MKSYLKPEITYISFATVEQISSLSTWLTTNGLTGAGITTYVINS